MAASLPASSPASSPAAGLFTNADHPDESCTSRGDHPLQAGMTDSKAVAAATAEQAAAAAAAGGAASKNKHRSTGSAAAAVAAAPDDDDDDARGGAAVVVGTSNGVLHCISCSTGQHLWQLQTGGSISTAAAFCPASRPLAPSQAPAAARTDELVDSPNRSSAGHLLVSCNNSGVVRVLSLPAAASPVASQDAQLGWQTAKLDEEVRQNPMPCTYASAQMPGGLLDLFSEPVSFAWLVTDMLTDTSVSPVTA